MCQIKREEKRRLDYIMRTQPYIGRKALNIIKEHLPNKKEVRFYSKKLLENQSSIIEAYKLLDKYYSYTEEELKSIWMIMWMEQRKVRKSYLGKPIKVRKDNFNTYGGEFKGYGTKRMPRKCRKTAWKRFCKLFKKD